jgi:hypothetical protein
MIAWMELDEGDWVRVDTVWGITTTLSEPLHGREDREYTTVLANHERFSTTLSPEEVLERIQHAVQVAMGYEEGAEYPSVSAEGTEVPERSTTGAEPLPPWSLGPTT